MLVTNSSSPVECGQHYSYGSRGCAKKLIELTLIALKSFVATKAKGLEHQRLCAFLIPCLRVGGAKHSRHSRLITPKLEVMGCLSMFLDMIFV